MELPVPDVERDHTGGAALEEDVGESAGRRPHVEAVAPRRVDSERVERVIELLAPAGDEPRPALDAQLCGLVDLLAGLRVAGNEAGEYQRLRLRSRLREPALDEEDVQALRLLTPAWNAGRRRF